MSTIPRHPRVANLPEEGRELFYRKERVVKELLQRQAIDKSCLAHAACELGVPLDSAADVVDGYVRYRKEKYFKGLLAERTNNNGELPHRKRKQAAKDYGVTPRRVSQLLNEYVAYAELYGAEYAVDYFRPLPVGRKHGTTMTDRQQAAVRFALLKRARMVVIEDERHVKDIEYSLRDVYNFARAICDEAGDPLPSEDTVGRFIRVIKESHPTVHELGLWGQDAVERKFIPKRANKVYRADARWQSDARDLPLYVLVDGQPCPVCLLIMYDDFTGYIIWWKLVAKIYREDNGRQHRINFTLRDVCSLFATAMYITGRMPDELYTDNGSQYIALRALLPYLINSQGKFPIMVNSRPGKPWGRGKVERGLGLVNELLKRLPGSYKKGDRQSINKARSEALPLEQVIKIFAEHFDHVNKRPQRRKPSRHDQYWSAISSPRPSFAKMVHLDIESAPDWAPINHNGFNKLGQAYEPKLREDDTNRDVYRLWLDAATSSKPIRIYPLKLDIGWRIEMHLVGEKDEAWLEAVPKESQPSEETLHNHDQRAALKDAVKDWRAILASDEALLRAHCCVMPELNPATGEYFVPEPGNAPQYTSGQPEEKAPLPETPPNALVNAASARVSTNGLEDSPVATTLNATPNTGTTPTVSNSQPRPRPPRMREDPAPPATQSSSSPDLSQLPDIDNLTEYYRGGRASKRGRAA